jgi:hypothetical protein
MVRLKPRSFFAPTLAVILLAQASMGATYQYDDGTFENEGGNSFVGLQSMVSVHHFNVINFVNSITQIQIAWPSLGLSAGDPAKVAIWSDPNNDGNPNDAVLLLAVNTTIQTPGDNSLTPISITPTTVGNSFFVGMVVEKNSAGPLSGRMMDLSPPISGQAWYADFLGSSANLNNLSSATFFGNPNNVDFGIRAEGVVLPEPATAALAWGVLLLIGCVAPRRRRKPTA